jgi:hypothetical protein
MAEGGRYDLVFDLDPEIVRVQCKWARRAGAVLAVKLDTNRCTPRGYVRTTYSPVEVDAFGIYSADLRRCFLIPIAEVSEARAVYLRLSPTRNNQARRIRWAEDYGFEAIIARWRASDAALKASPVHWPNHNLGL